MSLAFDQPDVDAPPPSQHPITETIIEVVRTDAQQAPRSRQLEIGPSEVGLTCQRRLAYRLLNWPSANVDGDPWAAVVGTAVHAWLASAFEAANARLGRVRWAVEKRLEIRPGLVGSCDLYDLDEGLVIDHKVVGNVRMTAVKRDGPPEQYRIQGQLYGYGWDQLGLPPTEVVLAFYPRGGYLGGLHVWAEPYDRAVAQRALERLDWLAIALDVLNIEGDPEHIGQIKASPSHSCTYCPWFNTRAKSYTEGCAGHLAKDHACTVCGQPRIDLGDGHTSHPLCDSQRGLNPETMKQETTT